MNSCNHKGRVRKPRRAAPHYLPVPFFSSAPPKSQMLCAQPISSSQDAKLPLIFVCYRGTFQDEGTNLEKHLGC